MKQHITEIQLSELTHDGLDKLHQFCNKHNYYIQDNGYKKPLLSIGQMIEFLGEDWYLDIFTANDIGDVLKMYESQVCDALWKATKEELEK